MNNSFNAQAIHAAVGSEVGTLEIPTLDYNTPSSFGSFELKQRPNSEFIGQSVDTSSKNMQTIRLMSIDSLKLPRVDFIKIDVEGMELEVMAGAKSTLEQHKPFLLIEAIKVDSQAMINEMNRYGYRHARIGINVPAIHESDPSCKEIWKS